MFDNEENIEENKYKITFKGMLYICLCESFPELEELFKKQYDISEENAFHIICDRLNTFERRFKELTEKIKEYKNV